METQGPQFVRKHWSIILAYMVFASFAAGLLVTAIIIVVGFARGMPITSGGIEDEAEFRVLSVANLRFNPFSIGCQLNSPSGNSLFCGLRLWVRISEKDIP
jgi:hypothetical protein